MLETKTSQVPGETPSVQGQTRYEVAQVGEMWRIKLAGDGFTEYAPTRSGAIARAKQVAKRAPSAIVVVLDETGAVAEQHEVKADRAAEP